jgi:hypothetical protein
VVKVLLGFVRVAPHGFFLEPAGRFIVLDADHVRADNPLEGMQHGAGAKPIFGTGPVRSVAQAHSIVIPVRKPESEQQSPRRCEPERVDELFAEQAHGCRAQNDDALLVQPDDALIGTKVQQLREMERLDRRLNGARLGLHGAAPFYGSSLVTFDSKAASIAVSSVDVALPVRLNDAGLATPSVQEGGSLAGKESANT